MLVHTVWNEFLKIVNEEVGSRVVETWFKAVTLSRWDSTLKVVYLTAPNTFVKDWVSANYTNLLKIHLGRLLNENNLSIKFLDETSVVHKSMGNASTQEYNTGAKDQCSNISEINIVPAVNPVKNSNNLVNYSQLPDISKKKSTLIKSTQIKEINKININKEYLFENFVVGPNNSLAYAAAKAVAERPGILYNPLFIYGDSGLGKTHLLHAIGNALLIENNKLKIVYQSADRFVADFINAIRFDKISFFENRYKNLDVLLVDDIQFISNKEQTQEAFFHIFNTLYEGRKQIVFSSDSLPKDIAGLATRLRSRLDGGLITDVIAPTLETKIAILKKKADLMNQAISDDVANLIASYQTCNVRELEGMLIRIIAFASINSEVITIDLVQKILNNQTQKIEKKEAIDLNYIANKISQYYKYSVLELRSSNRNKSISLARHVAMYLMKKLTDNSLNEIGAFWCRKDHSTVLHAIEKIEQYKTVDKLFNHELENIEKSLLGN